MRELRLTPLLDDDVNDVKLFVVFWPNKGFAAICVERFETHFLCAGARLRLLVVITCGGVDKELLVETEDKSYIVFVLPNT